MTDVKQFSTKSIILTYAWMEFQKKRLKTSKKQPF